MQKKSLTNLTSLMETGMAFAVPLFAVSCREDKVVTDENPTTGMLVLELQ